MSFLFVKVHVCLLVHPLVYTLIQVLSLRPHYANTPTISDGFFFCSLMLYLCMVLVGDRAGSQVGQRTTLVI